MEKKEFSVNGIKIILYHGDFFKVNSKQLKSIDAIITDFPYGTLNKRNHWDKVWDLPAFWEKIKTFLDINKPIISTAAQPFTSYLITSNYLDFKYTLVWEKSKSTGYLNAKKQPMRAHEDIVVFYKKQCVYNPQMTKGNPYDKGCAIRDALPYGRQTKAIHVKNDEGTRYPRSVQYFITAESEGKYHPTQKPIALFEWLIKTYSNENDTILDPCFGSGTTAISCIKSKRNFIGFEQDETFFKKACDRISYFIECQKVNNK